MHLVRMTKQNFTSLTIQFFLQKSRLQGGFSLGARFFPYILYRGCSPQCTCQRSQS